MEVIEISLDSLWIPMQPVKERFLWIIFKSSWGSIGSTWSTTLKTSQLSLKPYIMLWSQKVLLIQTRRTSSLVSFVQSRTRNRGFGCLWSQFNEGVSFWLCCFLESRYSEKSIIVFSFTYGDGRNILERNNPIYN